MLVKECMSSPAVTISPETLLQDAIKFMRQQNIRRLPVVDAERSLVGIVTAHDLYDAALRFHESPVEVEEFMTRDPVTTGAEPHIQQAAKLMMERKVGGLPVVDGQGNVVGIITESDIFKAFVRIMDEMDR